jgi:hypothetical protein
MRGNPLIIEMRTYKTRPGYRTRFLEIFESRSVPAHAALGMRILGPFLSVEDPDTFFFMRGFPDLASLDRSRQVAVHLPTHAPRSHDLWSKTEGAAESTAPIIVGCVSRAHVWVIRLLMERLRLRARALPRVETAA